MNKKSIILRILTALTVLALLLSGVGCGSDDSGKKSSKKKDNEDVSTVESNTGNEEKKLFTKTEVPALNADTVDYYYSADMNYTCFLACVDGRYGTMDDKGVMISETIFEKPYFTINYYSEVSKPDDSQFKCVLWCDNGEGIIVFDRDGGLLGCQQIPTGIEGGATVYWMNGKPVMVLNGGETGIVDCSREEYYSYESNVYNSAAYMNYPGIIESKIIAIREISDLAEDDSTGDTYYSPVFKSEKYGLFSFDKNEMITGFIYDECVGPIDGLFAVRQGDKWGYVTEKGKAITDFVYDVANVRVNEYDSSYKYNEMYLPVNGYVVTSKSGKYGMIDESGKTVLENKFDYVSQVNGDGVFFVLKGKKWYRCEMN